MAQEKILYLYIGAQKTASSMVRRALKAQLGQLNDNGIALIDRKAILASPFFKFLKAYPADGSRADPSERQLGNIRDLLEHAHPVTLATSEGMLSSLEAADFFQNAGPALAMMQRSLTEHRIRVILYTRAQKGFLESCYTQFIQLGHTERSFADFLGAVAPADLSWARVCDDIAAAVGRDNLIVRPFEIIRDLGSAGFIRDFLQILGLSEAQAAAFDLDAALAEGRAANRGFSQAAVDMARFTMPMLTPPQRRRLRRFLQENFSTESYPRPSYFSAEEAAALKAGVAAENRRLFETYMPEHDPVRMGYL